jgi:hypothetical protein
MVIGAMKVKKLRERLVSFGTRMSLPFDDLRSPPLREVEKIPGWTDMAVLTIRVEERARRRERVSCDETNGDDDGHRCREADSG